MSSRRLAGGRGQIGFVAVMGLMAAAAAALVAHTCSGESGAPEARTSVAPTEPAQTPVPIAAMASDPPSVPAPASASAAALPALLVHNPCSQPLLLAVNHELASGQRVNDGFYRIDPATRTAPSTGSGPIRLHSKTVHFYTETLETEPVETGGRQETVGDRQVGMRSVDLDPPGLTSIQLECPGVTSGKP